MKRSFPVGQFSSIISTLLPCKKSLFVSVFASAGPSFSPPAAFESAGEKRSIVGSAFVQHMNQRAHGISGQSAPAVILSLGGEDTPTMRAAGCQVVPRISSLS